jgi:hypothetical protein
MPARGRRGGGFPIWLGIILLLILGVVLWLFLKGDAFDEDAGSTGSDATVGGSANPGEDGAAGSITIGSDDLLGLAGEGNDALVDREGETVSANAVVVQSVVGDEAFWVGTGLDDRVLVVLQDPGESAPTISAGDQVSFRGTLEPLPIDFADRYGVSAEEDTALLTGQGHFVQAEQVEVQVT